MYICLIIKKQNKMKTEDFSTNDFKYDFLDRVELKADSDKDIVYMELIYNISEEFNLYANLTAYTKTEEHYIDGYHESSTYELVSIEISDFEINDSEGEIVNLDYKEIINYLEI